MHYDPGYWSNCQALLRRDYPDVQDWLPAEPPALLRRTHTTAISSEMSTDDRPQVRTRLRRRSGAGGEEHRFADPGPGAASVGVRGRHTRGVVGAGGGRPA